ncbi:hypothetical protein [Rubritalea tangerina]|uniref:SH3 domain-containing protein n=1 Tax=Rubritalea tangerina TaxID=430798 RepID=A0ABW4Z8H1_9BACT
MNPRMILVMASGVALVSCGIDEPDAQISFPVNPLDPVGFSRERTAQAVETADGAYRVGDYVEVAQPNTPLYPGYPRGRMVAKQQLPAGTVLNVLGLDGNYMHVQNEQGDEGYVSVMTVVPQGLLAADVPIGEDLVDMSRIDFSEGE